MKRLALTDSLASWHSFWIRFGQYIPKFPWDIEITNQAKDIDLLGPGDQLFFYRYSTEWIKFDERLLLAKERGVTIISDVDDYLWEAKGWNKLRLLGITKSLRICSFITCSTNHLKKQLEVMFPSIRIIEVANTAPITIENMYNLHNNLPIRVGWTGAPWTRPEDLNVLIPLAEWIKKNNSLKIKLVHIGDFPGQQSFANALSIPEENVETYPLQSHAKYIKNLNFNIGLAPLANSNFNQYKSPIKILEYSSQGIPWIASRQTPYIDICQKWCWKGRLCSSSEEWIKELRELLDVNIRLKEGDKLLKKCKQYSSFESGVNMWINLLK